jgi:hypothetical protein
LVTFNLEHTSQKIPSNCKIASLPSVCATTYSFFMLTQCSMNHAHVEENLGCVGDVVKLLQSRVELIVVVVSQGSDPRLYFLFKWSARE